MQLRVAGRPYPYEQLWSNMAHPTPVLSLVVFNGWLRMRLKRARFAPRVLASEWPSVRLARLHVDRHNQQRCRSDG